MVGIQGIVEGSWRVLVNSKLCPAAAVVDVRPCLTLGFQGPYYWVRKGSTALTVRSLEA